MVLRCDGRRHGPQFVELISMQVHVELRLCPCISPCIDIDSNKRGVSVFRSAQGFNKPWMASASCSPGRRARGAPPPKAHARLRQFYVDKLLGNVAAMSLLASTSILPLLRCFVTTTLPFFAVLTGR